MKEIFYLFAVFFTIYELTWVLKTKRKIKKSKEFEELSEKNKGLKFEDWSDDYTSMVFTRVFIKLPMIIWLIVGLFTFNWIAFLAILTFNILIIAPISKLLKDSIAYTILHWLNSLIGVIFGVFVIINAYHLKIDLYQLLLTYIQ